MKSNPRSPAIKTIFLSIVLLFFICFGPNALALNLQGGNTSVPPSELEPDICISGNANTKYLDYKIKEKKYKSESEDPVPQVAFSMEMGEELLRSSDFPQSCNEDKRIELAIKYFHEAEMNSCTDPVKCMEEVKKIKSFDNANIDEVLDAPLSDKNSSFYTDPDDFYVALINRIYAEYLRDGKRKSSTASIKLAYFKHCQATSDNLTECKKLLNDDDSSPGIGPLATRNCNYLNDRIKKDGRKVGPYCPKCPPLP